MYIKCCNRHRQKVCPHQITSKAEYTNIPNNQTTHNPTLPIPLHRHTRMTSRYQEAIYNPHTTAHQAKMTSTSASSNNKKWYSFLLFAEEKQTPTPIYDAPLRRPLFHHAKAGNEETQSARRYSVASTGSERRRSSVASVASALNPISAKSYWRRESHPEFGRSVQV
jgi:hypothetical protein